VRLHRDEKRKGWEKTATSPRVKGRGVVGSINQKRGEGSAGSSSQWTTILEVGIQEKRGGNYVDHLCMGGRIVNLPFQIRGEGGEGLRHEKRALLQSLFG